MNLRWAGLGQLWLGQLCAGLGLACDPVISLGELPRHSDAAMAQPASAPSTSEMVQATVEAGGCEWLACEGAEASDSVEVSVDSERGATFERVQAPVNSGEYAARFTTAADRSWSAFVFRFEEPISSDAVYVRMYIYLPANSVAGRLNFLAIENDDSFNVDVNLLAGDAGDVVLEVYNHLTRAGLSSDDFQVPEDQWLCLQTAVSLSETQGLVTVSIDGREVLRTPYPENTLPSGGITKVGVGAFWTEAGQTDSELFVDDIVVSQTVVPCL